MKKAFRWIGNTILSLLIILSISSLYSILQSKNNPGQLPSIMGYKVMTVLTGSMEPKLRPGDLIIVKEKDPKKVKVDDVITYRNSPNTLVTHRIVELMHQGEYVFFQTKGDANNVMDQGLVSSEQLVGSLVFNIPKAGYIANFIKSSTGLMVLATMSFLILAIEILKKIFITTKEEEKSGVKV